MNIYSVLGLFLYNYHTAVSSFSYIFRTYESPLLDLYLDISNWNIGSFRILHHGPIKSFAFRSEKIVVFIKVQKHEIFPHFYTSVIVHSTR